MNQIMKRLFRIIILLSFIYLLYTPNLESIELDLASAEESVGKRFANKFCEAIEEGLSSETSSEFALNNTYLKFVSFPDDKQLIEDLSNFTIDKIRKECGDYITNNEENYLRDFLEEESNIARNRDLYLPN